MRFSKELEDLANLFAGEKRTDATALKAGWGQFLQLPGVQNQIGLYGTAAAAITLAKVSRAAGAFADVGQYFERLWQERQGAGARYFVQTPRLAFFVKAVTDFGGIVSQQTVQDAVRELWGRRLTNGMWPSWDSGQGANQRTDMASTGLAMLALSAAAQNDPALKADLKKSAEKLEELLPEPADRNHSPPLIVLWAIANAIGGAKLPRKARSWIHREFRKNRRAEEAEYQFIDFVVNDAAGPQSRRDYFYVPTLPLQLMLAAQLTPAWAIAEGALERSSSAVQASLQGNAYKRPNSTYVASLDQSWAAMALFDASNAAKSKAPIIAVLKRNIYRFFRDRGPYLWRDFLIPTVCGLLFFVAAQNPNLVAVPVCMAASKIIAACAYSGHRKDVALGVLQFIGLSGSFAFGTLFLWRIQRYVTKKLRIEL